MLSVSGMKTAEVMFNSNVEQADNESFGIKEVNFNEASKIGEDIKDDIKSNYKIPGRRLTGAQAKLNDHYNDVTKVCSLPTVSDESVWVPYDNNRPVGLLGLNSEAKDLHGYSEVKYMVAHPKVSGRGCGKAMIEKAVNFSVKSGNEGRVVAFNVMKGAEEIYKKWGFENKDECMVLDPSKSRKWTCENGHYRMDTKILDSDEKRNQENTTATSGIIARILSSSGKKTERIGDYGTLKQKLDNKTCYYNTDFEKMVTSDIEATARRNGIVEKIKNGEMKEHPKYFHNRSCRATQHEYALVTKDINSGSICTERYHLNKFKENKWTGMENHGDITGKKYYFTDMLIHQYEVISRSKGFYGHLPSVYKGENIVNEDTFSKMSNVERVKKLDAAGELNDFFLKETVIGRARQRLLDTLGLESISTVVEIEKGHDDSDKEAKLNIYSILQPKEGVDYKEING
nr:GNAT family N-acetyltransferase [Pantoea cypripedii]